MDPLGWKEGCCHRLPHPFNDTDELGVARGGAGERRGVQVGPDGQDLLPRAALRPHQEVASRHAGAGKP